ncbi:hypothetical protein CFP66_42360 [Pseudonocardia sp. MH-G8]|nr:hypothetical protein CFP66_42360 [Pseudonocardia sp. MH-G8]
MHILLSRIAPTLLVLASALAPVAHPVESLAQSRASTGVNTTTQDPTDLTATVDGMLHSQLRDLGIPGATVSIVGGGRRILEKGYGLADVGDARPVSAERTTFHINSVTKVFTATAVMQLVEQGRMALDADVNTYLTAFDIVDTYPGRPVRLQDLLTHTSGFEDPLVDPATPRSPTLAEHVARHQPPRVRPPGEVHSYADYNYDLAGHLVEIVSGRPYEQYVSEQILTPLGMAETRFAVRPTDPLSPEHALSYTHDGDRLVEAERGFDGRAPSVGIVTTAADMSRFLLAQLGHPVDGVRLLAPPVVDLMHREHFGRAQGQPGVTIPLFESFRGDSRLLGHSGEGPGSHSMLTLWPQRGIGLFVAYNGDGLGGQPPFDGTYRAREELRNAVVDAVAGLPRPSSAGPVTPPGPVSGTYRWVKFTHRDPAQLFTLLAVPDLAVDVVAGGIVTRGFSAGAGRSERAWTAEREGVYRSDDGSALTFSVVRDGTPWRAATSYNNYSFVLDRVPWYDELDLHLAAFSAALLSLSTMLAWPAAWLLRRSSRRRGPRAARAARLLAAGTFVVLIGVAAAGQYAFVLGADAGAVLALHTATSLVIAATAGTVVCAALAWRRRWWSRSGRAHFAILATALAVVLVFVLRYDLVGLTR